MSSLKPRNKKNRKDQESAYGKALILLGYRALSEMELRAKLQQRGYEAEETNQAVEKLKSMKYINDEELSSEVFAAYKNQGVYGNAYIIRKLRARGLPVNDTLTEDEELEQAGCLLKKKFPGTGSAADLKHMSSFLANRGYRVSVIREVLVQKGLLE